jgi:hypothetical protein
MKNKHVLLLSLSLLMGSTVSFSQKTDKEIEKDISSKSIKLARKEAKKLKSEGWDVAPGALPLEKLLEKSYIKAEQENAKGNTKYIFADGNGVAQTKTAAEMQALTFAKLALASQIESNVNALVSGNVANQQIDKDDAESITQAVANSKELISAQLGYVEPTFKIYRTPKGNPENVEVQIRLFYDTEQSMQIAKKVIQKELKDKLKVNEEQLNKMMGIE